MKVTNLPRALCVINQWTVEDFRRVLADEADGWAQEGYVCARGWTTGRFEDEDEWADAQRCADDAQDACHHVRAPFAWAAYYAPSDASTSDLFQAWLQGLNREAEYRGERIDAMVKVHEYQYILSREAV